MLLYLTVKPNQRFNKVEKVGDGYQVRLKAPAVDGKANEALIKFLSDLLDIPKSKIVLKKGHTSRIKCLDIDEKEEVVLEKLN